MRGVNESKRELKKNKRERGGGGVEGKRKNTE
jgi:hypothetical protein